MGAQEEKGKKEIPPPMHGWRRDVLEALSTVAASAPWAGWERTDVHRVVLCGCPAPRCPRSSTARGGQCRGSLHHWHRTCTLVSHAPTLLCATKSPCLLPPKLEPRVWAPQCMSAANSPFFISLSSELSYVSSYSLEQFEFNLAGD